MTRKSIDRSLRISGIIAFLGLAGCGAGGASDGGGETDNGASASAPGAGETDNGVSASAPGAGGPIELAESAHSGTTAISTIEGNAVIEGDIVVVQKQSDHVATSTSAVDVWHDGVVPFVIDSKFPDKERVTDAIDHWEKRTGVRFVARKKEKDYVRFFSGDGCYSYIGRVGGKQDVSLGDGCTTGNAIHEIGSGPRTITIRSR